MAIEPTDAEAVKGQLRLELGGTAHRVAVLPIRAADAWIETFQASLASVATSADDVLGATDVTASLIEVTRRTTHAAVDLIVAYDRDGALGGRDWILDHATPEEVTDALEVLRVSALPFARGILSMVDVFRMAAETRAAQSSQPSSTNGHSPAGTLPQDHLKPRSRTRSSTSSGKLVRSA